MSITQRILGAVRKTPRPVFWLPKLARRGLAFSRLETPFQSKDAFLAVDVYKVTPSFEDTSSTGTKSSHPPPRHACTRDVRQRVLVSIRPIRANLPSSSFFFLHTLHTYIPSFPSSAPYLSRTPINIYLPKRTSDMRSLRRIAVNRISFTLPRRGSAVLFLEVSVWRGERDYLYFSLEG